MSLSMEIYRNPIRYIILCNNAMPKILPFQRPKAKVVKPFCSQSLLPLLNFLVLIIPLGLPKISNN